MPVGSHSRTWEAGELLLSRLELEVRAIQETLSKLRHITAYSANLEVQVSEEARHLISLAPRLHPDLWARIIDIRAYKPRLLPKATTPFPAGLLIESVGDWEGLVGEPPALEEEAAAQLRVPAYLPKRARFIKGNSVHVFFDGGP